MKLYKTPIHGAFRVELTSFQDTRGVFAETFVKDKFLDQGVRFEPVMMNMSLTEKAGTVRGMHWQAKPFSQGKLVFSSHGRIFDAIVDVRRRSPTFGAVYHLELVPQTNALFIPKGVAHGCQAQEDRSMLVYLLDGPYKPTHERGLQPTDPKVAIPWPLPPINVARRDLGWPTLAEIGSEDEKPLHLAKCGHEQHCHCERDEDGRCASCYEIIQEMVRIMVRTIKESQDRMNEEGEQLGDLCDICGRETADYMLSRVARTFTDPFEGPFSGQKVMPFIVSAIRIMRDAVGRMKGVTDWPLFEKAMTDVTDRLQQEPAE